MVEWTVILGIFTGLVIFIFGIEHLSKEILLLAKQKFNEILRKSTKNRFVSTLLGTIISALMQSSTATTVITVSLVSTGIISFYQSLGIIFGANIGTTITVQFISLKITSLAPFFMIGGFILSIVGRSYRYLGKALFYFGLLFFGLNIISDAVLPIKDDPFILDLFSKLSNVFIALLAGFLVTATVQSSAITTGIVVVLAINGIISLSQALPILLGSNIGTTVTAFISSMRLNVFARRAALAHSIFNVIGVLLLLPFITPFSKFIMYIGGSEAQQIANAHTIFNIAAAFVFLLFTPHFKNLIEYLIPSKDKEILLRPKYIGDKLPKSNSKSFIMIEKELLYFLDINLAMFDKSVNYIIKRTSQSEFEEIEKMEALSDLLDEKIEESLLKISQRNLSKNEAQKVVVLVRISNLIEQLSDMAEDIAILPRTMTKSQLILSDESRKSIEKLYSQFRTLLIEIQKSFLSRSIEINYSSIINSSEVFITKSYKKHIELLSKKEAYAGSIFVESLSYIESAMEKLHDIIILNNKYSKIGKTS